MVIGFIEPTYEVIKDYYVTTEEVKWYGQELVEVVVGSIMFVILTVTITTLITKAIAEA